VTIGPKVENAVVFVRTLDRDGNPIKAGRICESKKVEVEFTTESGRKVRQKIDVGGFYIVPPSNQE
jgi:hypothetical protein